MILMSYQIYQQFGRTEADIYNDDFPNLKTFYNFSGVYSLFDASNAELLKRFSLMTCFLNRLMNSNYRNTRAVFMETSNLSAHSIVKHWPPVNQQRYQPLTGKITLHPFVLCVRTKRNVTQPVYFAAFVLDNRPSVCAQPCFNDYHNYK